MTWVFVDEREDSINDGEWCSSMFGWDPYQPTSWSLVDIPANYHGGGSPVMEQIAITTQYDIESRKKLVKYIAGMSGGDRDALSPVAKKAKK